ncbi:MAG: hypothetical protein O3C10_08285 [Chloroflexi bacterium]|nr:hypothetical protein [Chloroflexota bacterium]
MESSRRGLRRSAGLALAIASIGAVMACVQTTSRNSDTLVPAPTSSPVAATTATPISQPVATPVAPAPTAAPVATATPSPTPISIGSTPTQIGLFLELQGLSENTVVFGNAVVASGLTSPDAVLSINGVIIPISDDGSFEVTLALSEGPNLLEVVSSDLSGNQESRVLWIVALPEGA